MLTAYHLEGAMDVLISQKNGHLWSTASVEYFALVPQTLGTAYLEELSQLRVGTSPSQGNKYKHRAKATTNTRRVVPKEPRGRARHSSFLASFSSSSACLIAAASVEGPVGPKRPGAAVNGLFKSPSAFLPMIWMVTSFESYRPLRPINA